MFMIGLYYLRYLCKDRIVLSIVCSFRSKVNTKERKNNLKYLITKDYNEENVSGKIQMGKENIKYFADHL